MLTNLAMHRCAKKMKTEEAKPEAREEEEEEGFPEEPKAGPSVPDSAGQKGGEKVFAKFMRWMVRNEMGSDKTASLYLSALKTFFLDYEEKHPSYSANDLLCPVETSTFLPSPISYLLSPDLTVHVRKTFYNAYQKFIEFLLDRFDSLFLMAKRISNDDKNLYKNNLLSIRAKLREKRKKVFKDSAMASLQVQSERMKDDDNLTFNTQAMVRIIRDFMATKKMKEYKKTFASNSEDCYRKIAKSSGLPTLEVRNLAIVLLHIFGGGKRADALMNLLIKEFDNRHEVSGMIQISVFKHKTAQSGSALISYEKDSLTDVVMNVYRHHFRVMLQPKLESNQDSDWCRPLEENDFFFVSDQAKQLRRCTPALEWMRNVLIQSYPENYNLQFFKGFTSGAFQKAWANMGEELEDATLRDYGPKSLDHSRAVTEKYYLNKRMATTANFSKAVAKAIRREDDESASGGSTSEEDDARSAQVRTL